MQTLTLAFIGFMLLLALASCATPPGGSDPGAYLLKVGDQTFPAPSPGDNLSCQPHEPDRTPAPSDHPSRKFPLNDAPTPFLHRGSACKFTIIKLPPTKGAGIYYLQQFSLIHLTPANPGTNGPNAKCNMMQDKTQCDMGGFRICRSPEDGNAMLDRKLTALAGCPGVGFGPGGCAPCLIKKTKEGT